MDQINLRTFSRLRYKDPRSVLVDMATVERSIASADIDPRVKQMRTRDLRSVRELRQACLFWHGVSEVTGQKFGIAHCEDEDYDAVATWVRDGTQSFAPTQLKEVPPEELNPVVSVQAIVNGLTKYPSSTKLTVAIHLNRVVQFAPSELVIPRLGVAAVWVFGAIRPDRSRWAIWGNFLDPEDGWQAGEFNCPTA
jgi:hypothetical protein